MNEIMLLDQETIDKIAAGEVVARPSSVVKELVENSMDAGANAVTVEIRDGGISLIRVTDNGTGIPAEQIRHAFMRHATSKIRSASDLTDIRSLGFRGEALSSISAVSRMELITRTADSLLGSRYAIDGGHEKILEEVGAPEGSTFLVRSLFYNTPARLKFLKSAVTEGGYVGTLMEHLALSHPDVSFKFINNGQVKLHTPGSGNIRDIVYRLYGKQTASSLIPVESEGTTVRISGFIGIPSLSRGNREYEHYFVNGRYVRSDIICKALEDAYEGRMMQHRYPFSVLFIEMDGSRVDVNVHPSKHQVRFYDNRAIYDEVLAVCKKAVEEYSRPQQSTPSAAREEAEAEKEERRELAQERSTAPEPFEKVRSSLFERADSPYFPLYKKDRTHYDGLAESKAVYEAVMGDADAKPIQQELPLPEADAGEKIQLLGQMFRTYWVAVLDDRMYIIDQHAAHEKILYEQFLKAYEEKQAVSQQLYPPHVISLTDAEEELYLAYADVFRDAGFEIEHFGGREYTIRAVPDNLYGFTDDVLFTQMLDNLDTPSGTEKHRLVFEKLAGMACKAAVKGNHTLSFAEAKTLIETLLKLDNPFNCPHGRPTIIEMSKYEIDRKFKRIVG